MKKQIVHLKSDISALLVHKTLHAIAIKRGASINIRTCIYSYEISVPKTDKRVNGFLQTPHREVVAGQNNDNFYMLQLCKSVKSILHKAL